MKSTPGVARPTDHPTFARASVTFASIVQSSRVDVVASSRARASRLAADATFSGRRDRSHRLPPPSIARVRARASTSDRIASLSRAPARRRFLRSRGVVHRARERVRVRAQVPTLRSRPRPRARERESERGARANAARLRARTATARERGATRANATRRATVGCGRWTFEFIVERVRRERRA
jgi:hypothetical protein